MKLMRYFLESERWKSSIIEEIIMPAVPYTQPGNMQPDIVWRGSLRTDGRGRPIGEEGVEIAEHPEWHHGTVPEIRPWSERGHLGDWS